MELNFYNSESTERPSAVDTTSSSKYVYVRRNVRTEVRESQGSDEKVTYYVYEEAKLTKDEYSFYLHESSASDTLATQIAIAELGETIETNYTETQKAIAELAEAMFTE